MTCSLISFLLAFSHFIFLRKEGTTDVPSGLEQIRHRGLFKQYLEEREREKKMSARVVFARQLWPASLSYLRLYIIDEVQLRLGKAQRGAER